MKPNIYPVVHFLDRDTAFDQVGLAREKGAAGAFLISHMNDDDDLLVIARDIKLEHPSFRIGVNFLSFRPLWAARAAADAGLDMVWADSMGVTSAGLTDEGRELQAFGAAHPRLEMFASVAFKYQANEFDPRGAAREACRAGFIPTTSGSATGSPPDLAKIIAMAADSDGLLSVASGMTPENVADFVPYLGSILVATGISADEHHIDPEKLVRFIEAACRRLPLG